MHQCPECKQECDCRAGSDYCEHYRSPECQGSTNNDKSEPTWRDYKEKKELKICVYA